MTDDNLTYKDSGVDVDAGNEFVKKIKPFVKNTFRPEVLTDLGGFGGLFNLNKDKYKEPVLVSGTDGVGTKLKIAFLMNKHDTVGIDLVAMCANDIIVSGAEPLFFLDYLASGKLDVEKSKDIVKGIADGCSQAGCALLGGETAEMPDFYKEGEYDMAGFVVGVVDKEKIIDGKNIKAGDAILGISSSGLHSNGFSLVRKIIFDKLKLNMEDKVEELGCAVGDEILKPTKIYVKTVLEILKSFEIKGISHITGGGFTENIPRVLPDGVSAKITRGNWDVPQIFKFLKREGNVEKEEMFKTFNMGIGLVLIVNDSDKEEVLKKIESLGDKAFLIGEVIDGEKQVVYEGCN